MSDAGDARRFAPAAARNREPIAQALEPSFATLPAGAGVLEIASGSGEHALHLAARFPGLAFLPSDTDPSARSSVDAWREQAGLENLHPAAAIDVIAPDWVSGARAAFRDAGLAARALYCANMIHIAPWEACQGLWRGAGELLETGSVVALYGPFRRGGRHTAPSNESFDESLRARDPSWGVRDLEAVCEEAEGAGLALERDVAMPANNALLVFRRR